MYIDKYIESNHVKYAENTIQDEDISTIESILQMKIGPQLKHYLVHYGCLKFRYFSTNKLNPNNIEQSNLISETIKFHKKYTNTKGYIVLRQQNSMTYALIDSNDNICYFDIIKDTFIYTDIKLYKYIIDCIDDVKVHLYG